jgi:uncharacterized membrane protein YphA (DoxX/SURF4 family)
MSCRDIPTLPESACIFGLVDLKRARGQESTMMGDVALSPEVQQSVALDDTDSRAGWGLAARVTFRFAFVYFALYNFPFPLGLLPSSYADERWEGLWHKLVPWVGAHVLHIGYPITVFTNGSGDTTYDYVKILCLLMLAALATIVWSLLDRKRAEYRRLQSWFLLYIRLVLGSAMITYGAFKVIQAQFPTPSLTRLMEPYGDSSPMGLLWTLMGASKGYNIFAGAAEMLGGILLFVPQLATLGALISVGVISNIFALNMAYDTPVKLYSLHLLLMAAIVAGFDARRMIDVLLLNRSTEPTVAAPLFRRRRLQQVMLGLQLALGAYVVCDYLYQSHTQAKTFAQGREMPIYGIWAVDQFTYDGQNHPPLLTDPDRWQRVIFQNARAMTVQMMDGTRQTFLLKLDTAKNALAIDKSADKNWHAQLTYDRPEPTELTLTGQFGGHPVTANLHRIDENKFLLNSRGFHWINEFPFNR